MTTLSFFSATGGELTLVSQALSRLRTRGLDITLFGRTKDQITDPELARAFAQAAARSDAIVLSFHGDHFLPGMARTGRGVEKPSRIRSAAAVDPHPTHLR